MNKLLIKNIKELYTKLRHNIPVLKPNTSNFILGIPFNSKLSMKYELSVSQDNQDLIALFLLKKYFDFANENDLRVVDIGANHPIVLSNTLYFERMFGAKVFAFEPNILLKELWESHRPETNIYYNGVSDKKDTLTLFVPEGGKDEFNNDVFASFDKANSKLGHLKGENINSHRVEVAPLGSFLDYGLYDLLFIDTEGHELSVINGIDFKQFQFKVIVIENNYVLGGSEEIRSILQSKGYKLVLRTFGRDDFYINTTL